MKQSLWLSDQQPISAPSVQQSITCDICIVGGGISGIYSAYLLAKQGFSVVLIEGLSHFANGTTAYSTGKLTTQHQLIYSKLSLEDGLLYYKANRQAIEQVVEQNPESFSRATSFLYSTTKLGKEQLTEEAKRYEQLGIPYIATKDTELSLSIELALGIKDEAQINPVAFTNHFASLARKHGAELYLNTRITSIDLKKRHLLTSLAHSIHYKKLILCTHYPIEAIKNLTMLKLQISRSYLTATKCNELLEGQYLSIDTPGRTIRTASIDGNPYFIYGGYSHIAGTNSEVNYYESLQQEVQALFELPAPSFCWDAQDMMTFDQIPFIGQVNHTDDSLYIATGFNKWGLSSSLVAGQLLCDLLKGIKNPTSDLFSPSRSNFGKALYFMLQNGSFISKEFIKGYLTRRDAPRCTHLGCKTRWNENDETWDCPCHGSRYNKEGQVIEGPAVYPLDIKKSGHST
ncbi:FAD-dependent oxidoreductase [Solibacillus daqui]|uniref:FAD-dependent oxidoreductase n=1 Tax=Solibacillus daqui TaxID=2912187 RepID=UPI0023652142|nr:FAD-dependent oxidoreductase [Solibacillus daqui]